MFIYPIYPVQGVYNNDQHFDVSVIIPLYKSAVVVAEQIQKWHSDDKYSVEIVYVDDKCPQRSKDVITREWNARPDKYDHNVKLILSPKNKGFAGACNTGAFNASGTYLIFLNADTIVTPNWVGPMIDLFQDPKVGIVGNLHIKEGGPYDGTIDSAGSEWSWEFMNFLHIGRHFCHGKPLIKPMRPEEAPKDILSIGEREMVTGCCFAIPRKLFDEVGGFDQRYKVGYWEDSELNMEVRNRGYKVMFQPDSIIYHKLGHSEISEHKFTTSNKNIFINKWIIPKKLDTLVKDKRPSDLAIDNESLDRVFSPRMNFYRNTYQGSKKWDGKTKLLGKKVVVYCEQGLGDTIQFSRYGKLLKEMGCHLTLHCAEELHELFLRGFSWIDAVLDKNRDNLPEHDYHVLSMSLPFLLVNRDEIDFPYIDIKDKTDLGDETGFKIGISWEGSPDHSNNKRRSCPLSYFRMLSQIKGVKLFMIQKHVHLPEYIEGCDDLELFGTPVENFLDTAKLLNALDLIVSVDTSVLHLAGALSRPAIALLSKPCDARWDVKEWYPSISFIKQREEKVWDTVFAELIEKVKIIK